MTIPPPGITELLVAHRRGTPHAFEQVVQLVYADLRRVARAQRRRVRPGETLDTTELVHEAYLKLIDQTDARWCNRAHFLAVSALAMRQIVVDDARRRGRVKRGGGVDRVALDDAHSAAEIERARILDVDVALGRLATVDARLVQVVECRYFAGLTEEETAEALGVSLRTAQRDWLKARAWLRAALS